MNKTKVEEMLIEMISPKVKEIEQKFSQGIGLGNEDVNTLLLKSQFNHINHLDDKLDEVTADVASLKLEFSGLKSDVKTEIAAVKSEFANLRADVKSDIASLKSEIASLKTDVQSSINKNMQWSIGLITFIVTALKVVDMIWGK